MKVTTIIAHDSADKETHRPGESYELAGIELELRLKDGIVREATAAPVPEPTVAEAVAAAMATVRAVVGAQIPAEENDATRDLPPSDPEE